MRFSVFTILFALFFATGARLWVCVNYMINQKYYAEVLCKNKAVKNSCCKGKCVVEKELADLEQEEDPGRAPQLKLAKAEEALCVSLRLNVAQGKGMLLGAAALQLHYPAGHRHGLLRPPLA